MGVAKFRNYGKYGVITDIPSFDLPPEAWSDANNVRFVANRFEKMSGFTPTLQTTANNKPALFFAQEPETNTSGVIYATPDELFLINGPGTPTPINPDNVKFEATPQQPWGVAILSNVMVFNNGKNDPVAWIPGNSTQKVTNLPGWGIPRSGGKAANIKCEWKAKSIKAYKNYLIALNTTEEYLVADNASDPNTSYTKKGAKLFPQRVRWSGISQPGELPTDWVEDDPNKDGGAIDLADCIGNIVDGRPMRDFFLVYTDRETYIMKYVGGQFVFDIQKLFPDSGLLNPNCVCEFEGGNHFVVSNDDIFVHDGSTRKSVATDLIKSRVLNDIISVKYEATKVFAYPARKEIWLCYVSKTAQSGAEDNFALDKAAVWNWDNGTWTFTDLPSIYWMDNIITPNNDVREWNNPSSRTLATPTEIVLDVPFESLPVGFSFRVDVLFKPNEGLQSNSNIRQKLKWTSSNQTVATTLDDPYDGSTILNPLSPGKTNLSFVLTTSTWDSSAKTWSAYVESTDAKLKGTFEVTVTGAGTEAVLRNQNSIKKEQPTLNITNPRPDQFPDAENQWDADLHKLESWEKKGYSFAAKQLIASSQDNSFYQMDFGRLQTYADTHVMPTSGQSGPVVAYIKRDAFPMSDFEPDLSYHKTWRNIYPLISGDGTVTFIIGGSNNPFSSSEQDDRQSYVIGQDYKIDCFTNYRFISIEIRDDEEGDWQMSGMDVDYFIGGKN